ncbi:MAG: DUF6599 family protein [Terracidiphilus sp.]
MKFTSNGWMLPVWFSLFAAFMGMMVAVTSTTGCKKKSVDPFPATGAITGWDKTSETRVYAAKDLYQYIDGDAEQYISAGVVSTSTSDYKYQGKLEATVDVYTMGGADGARTIFEKGQTRDAQTVQLGDAGIAYSQSVTFRKGPALVRITAYESTPNAQAALLALAHGIEAKL